MSAPDANGWLPIETAPRDHHLVLTWSLHTGRVVAFLDATWEWWSSPAERPLKHKPTHWQPLPKPPATNPHEGG